MSLKGRELEYVTAKNYNMYWQSMPSDAYVLQPTIIYSDNGLRLIGTKPLSQPVVVYYWMGLWMGIK